MIIDNFELIKSKLTFTSQFDRYIIHIIKRAKDDKGKTYGVNETNRLLKTFYITSVDYLDKKIPVIKDLCDSNSARAYIIPQVRNNEDCLKELLKVVVDNLSNPSIKPDHLVRTAYCGYHGSRDKKWILDLDNDNMVEYVNNENRDYDIKPKEWTAEEVLSFVQGRLEEIGKSKDCAYLVPTKNGHCIVTSPFDLKKAHDKCNMMFQGETNMPIAVEYTGPYDSEVKYKKMHGWLIKDGMALLYMNNGC